MKRIVVIEETENTIDVSDCLIKNGVIVKDREDKLVGFVLIGYNKFELVNVNGNILTSSNKFRELISSNPYLTFYQL